MTLNVTRRLVGVVAASMICATVSAGFSANPAHAVGVEDYASYDPQTRCVSKTKPGTEFLLNWLVRKYPNTRRSSTLRSCSSGGTSEHKDGRALDWGVDAAIPAQRATVARMLDKIFATDAAGNPHALARRMGIMYLIWNDHMYRAYESPRFAGKNYLSSGCPSRRRCSKTLRHRDHVHISLSRPGAAARTSFYVNRNVPTARMGRR